MSLAEVQDPQVQSIIEQLRSLSNQVKMIDNELGTQKGDQALRNEIASSYVSKFNAPNIQKNEQGEDVEQNPFNRFIATVINNVKTHFSATPEQQVAIYTEIHNQLSKEFGKKIREHLDAEVKKLPKQETPQISDEKRTELATQRTRLVNLFKLQQEMLKYYEDAPELPSDIEVPSARKGAIGGRGDKLTRQYAFYVGDNVENLKHRTVKIEGKKSEVTLGNIASTVAKDAFLNTVELKKYIIEQLGVEPKDGKVDFGAEWTVTLPQSAGGKILRGVEIGTPTADAVVDESDDDEDEEDEDSEGTETQNETEEDMFS